jgi:ectoine hydroxylase-related dioxygenase (phytanoyl-CoA dioxygenase family)
MNTTTMNTTTIKARGQDIGGSQTFGELRRSDDIQSSPASLQERLEEDGYLYIPGFFDREEILSIRKDIVNALAEKGLIDTSFPLIDAVKSDNADMSFQTDPRLAVEFMTTIAKSSSRLQKLLYSGRIIQFFEGLFREPVRHFDFTWTRMMGRGQGTEPHCDIVYMSRGTSRLLTSWIPYGDISYDVGGLMMLENSHQQAHVLANYLKRDVDNYCENRPEAEKIKSGEIPYTWNGVLSKNPASLQQKLGGRWLSAEYRMGDILIFGMKIVHAGMDNQSNRFRFSTDTRYQPASEPIDERWIGEKPVGHGPEAKRGYIC